MTEFRPMTIKKSTTGLIAMAGLMGGLVLASAPAFARNGANQPSHAAATDQLVPTSQMAQLLACNHMMQDHRESTMPSAPSNNG
jgi:hypothetical protein